MKLTEIYKGKIVHVVGGFKEYIGELVEHPLKDWLRIKGPCLMLMVPKNANNPQAGAEIKIIRITDSKVYEDYVDTFMSDACFEIRELGKEGFLYKAYVKEMERPDAERILTPDNPEFGKVVGQIGDLSQGRKEKARRKKRIH